MVQFGATLEQQRNEDWKEYYIDYHGLKKQLKRLKAAYDAASRTHKLSQEFEAVSPLQMMQGAGAGGGRNVS
ncbi:unnamed protein product, partial [Ectocarpus fasciculatus]